MGRDGRGVKGASESSIEITFMYRGVRCRERIALKPTTANLKRAEQHRAAVLHAIATNCFDYAATFPNSSNAAKFASVPGDVQTVERYLDAWLDRQKSQRKASAYDTYRKIVQGRLIPWFGHLRLSEFKRTHMRDQLAELDVTNKTLGNIQSVMRSALDDAMHDELIETNPLAGWSYTKNEPPRDADEIDPFSRDEQEAILAALEGQGRNLVQFAFWTGLRTSELVALDWADVDFLRGVVRVQRAMTQNAAGKAEVTKTYAGRREVKLLRGALDALVDQKQHTWLSGKEVFQNPQTRERWQGDQPIRKTLWQWALKKANVRYRYPYQTRHTYASMMLSAGEPPMWVAKQMGHKDWTMIARRYGRWMPDADKQAGSRAEAIYGAEKTKDATKAS
jgi:integrase